MRVVPYESGHAEALREVCIAQASERARTSALHREFTLLMYCDPYLEHGIAYTLLNDANEPSGYVLSSGDLRSWLTSFEPYRRRIAELDLAYAQRMNDELSYYVNAMDEYPSHLHIDISEDCCGGGGGRMLIEALLERLRAEGISGVTFGVAASNERAVGFYRHMGFTELDEFGGGNGYTFGMKL